MIMINDLHRLNGRVFEINNEKMSDFAYEVAGFKDGKKSKNEVIIITEYGEVEPVKTDIDFDDGRYIFSMNIPYIERGKGILIHLKTKIVINFLLKTII